MTWPVTADDYFPACEGSVLSSMVNLLIVNLLIDSDLRDSDLSVNNLIVNNAIVYEAEAIHVGEDSA